MKAGRELDALIAEKVFGRPESYYHCPHFSPEGRLLSFCSCPDLPNYSTRIQDAWQVVEKFAHTAVNELSREHLGLSNFSITAYPSGGWSVRLGLENAGTTHVARADTAPLAICLAALKAVGYE